MVAVSVVIGAAMLTGPAAAAMGVGGQSGPNVSLTETWCLDPANSAHVAAAAASLGSVVQHGENVKVNGRTLSVKKWSRQAQGAFDVACRRAFKLYGPLENEPEDDDDSDGDGLDGEDWWIPVVTALGGAVVGAGAAHSSAVLRDRKLQIREDAAAIRRLSVEVQNAAQVANALNLQGKEGVEALARVNRAVTELASLLDDEELAKDEAATEARTAIDGILDEIGKGEPESEEIATLGSRISELGRENALTWAQKLHPKPLLPV
jgi:hypothetical protein